MARVLQVGDNGIVSDHARAVVSDRNHGNPCDFLDPAAHGLGDKGGAAEGRAGLDEERQVGVIPLYVVHLQDIVHRFAGMFNPEAVR
jgi:hypothetical protein